MKDYIYNRRIRAKEVRLIDDEGTQLGVVGLEDALARADEKGLDLLLVSNASNPPVCKIVNIGQHKYQQQKKLKLAKKASKAQVIKEIKMGLSISENDYMVRVNRSIDFFKKGYKVKVTVMFRGREVAHPELGIKIINRFIADLEEYGKPDSNVSRVNRALTVVISSKVK